MKFERSRIVCNAKDAQESKDQAKHVAAVVVFFRASPTRTRSTQSNESAVDTSCTSLAFMIEHWKTPKEVHAMEILKNHKNSKDYLDSAKKHNCGTIVGVLPLRQKVLHAVFFFSQQLISDYSYSRGGGAELFPITVTAAVAARNYFPIPVTAAVAVRKDRK